MPELWVKKLDSREDELDIIGGYWYSWALAGLISANVWASVSLAFTSLRKSSAWPAWGISFIWAKLRLVVGGTRSGRRQRPLSTLRLWSNSSSEAQAFGCGVHVTPCQACSLQIKDSSGDGGSLGTGCLLARIAQLPIGPEAEGGGKQSAGGSAVAPPVSCPSRAKLVISCTQIQEASRPRRKS